MVSPHKSKLTNEPTSNQADFVPLLASISKTTRAFLGLKMARLDLVIGQDQLLTALARRKGFHISEVARDLLVRPSTVSKMIDQLESAGLCKRTRPDVDMRRIVVVLTPKGEKVAAEIEAIANSIEQELSQQIPSSRLPKVIDDISRAADALAISLVRMR